MAEYKRPTSESEFNGNFAQIKPAMTSTEAYYESSRCLFCYDAPCVKACPTEIDIPLFIKQINTGNDLGAAKTIYDSNFFGHACGKVCPTEVLCEGACVYNHSDVKPIEIGRLQAFATHKAIASNKKLYTLSPSKGKRVAVIGAGPAGISCACELRLQGIEVDIYESKSLPSGLTIHGVAPYKITNEEVLDEMKYLESQFGFTVYYDHKIFTKEDIASLEEKYDAIFIGVGLGETADMKIPGEEFTNVYGAVEWIELLRMKHHLIEVPNKVIVLGGGNTAMDAAGESARMGAESVLLAYRRSKEEMGAYNFEYELAKSVGVKGIFNVAPVEIIERDSKVASVRFIQTQSLDGSVQNIPGSEFELECDAVIKATGQSKHKKLFELIPGLETHPNSTIKVNPSLQTTHSKYFAAGDGVSGGEEVVNAVADGKKAAKGILNYLQN